MHTPSLPCIYLCVCVCSTEIKKTLAGITRGRSRASRRSQPDGCGGPAPSPSRPSPRCPACVVSNWGHVALSHRKARLSLASCSEPRAGIQASGHGCDSRVVRRGASDGGGGLLRRQPCKHLHPHPTPSRAAQAQLHALGTSSLNHPLDTRPTLSRSRRADSVQHRHLAAHDWPAHPPPVRANIRRRPAAAGACSSARAQTRLSG
jgi:hypothetical protein